MKAREADGHAAVPGRRGVRPWHAILVIFVVVLAAPAWAQDDDRTRYYLGLRGHGSNPFTEVHDLLGASVGVNVNRYWGFELAAEGFERRLRLDGKALGEYLLLPLVPQVRVRYPLLGGRLTPYALAGVGVAFTEFNDRKPPGYDVAVVIMQVDEAGKGDAGDYSPAAKVKFDESGALVVEDYAAEAVRLMGIARK